MKLHDHSQNLGIRVMTIQVIALLILGLLGVRLFYLQIVRGDYYENKAENQRIRLIPIPAPRGAILDRNGRILVDSRPTYNVTLSSEPNQKLEVSDASVEQYARGLNVDREYIVERLNLIKKQNEYETLVLKENASIEDITWVEAHSLEHPELRIELRPQRFYPHKEVLAHVLGYVGEISPKALDKPEAQEKGLRPGDIVGQQGLEYFYDDYLRGRPGYRKVIVDSRGRIQSELEIVPPQAGQDLVSTIDLDLQLAAEEELAKSSTKRGTVIATDPNTGEVLALASAPSFDPNVFIYASSTPEGRRQIAAYWQDKERPLLNRAIQGLYHPGSTWKIPESLAALQQGVITVENSNVACGGGIQIGSKFTRCMGSHGSPPISYAITKSCDGYYYRLALKMKIEGLIEMVEMFDFDKRSGIDLPNEKISQTPKSWKPKIEKRGESWTDIRTVYASIGQDTVVITPISLLRAVAAIGVKGNMQVPHLLKEFRPVRAIGEEGDPAFRPERPGFAFNRPNPKVIPIAPENEEVIVKGMWGVVNDGGTAASIRIPGFDIAGKTGTAQVAELGKDVGDKKDHAWFVSFAPAYKPEVAVLVLIENSGFGGANAAPAAKGVYTAYLKKQGRLPSNEEIAEDKAKAKKATAVD